MSIVIIYSLFWGSILFEFKNSGYHRKSDFNPNIKFSNQALKIHDNILNKNVLLYFKSQNGEFWLRGNTNNLTEYDLKNTYGEYIYLESEKNGKKVIDIRFNEDRVPWKIFFEKNFLDLRLNSNVIWSLHYEIKNSLLDADLSYYKINDFSINASTNSNVNLYINGSCIVNGVLLLNLDSRFSNINIKVEENNDIGIKLEIIEKKFSTIDIQKNKFIKNDENILKTKNYDNASKRINIKINSDYSRIKLNY